MKKLSAMIVESDTAIREALVRTMSAMGAQARTADSPFKAIDFLRSDPTDVVILDWDLGVEIDGIDIANLIVSEGLPTKIIFIAGNSIGALREQTSHLTVVDYLKKPFGSSELRYSLKKLEQ